MAAGDSFGDLDARGDPRGNLLYGARVINSVALDGSFLQTATGHLNFDIAFGPYASDQVLVTGSAEVDGTGTIILTWLENADPVTLFTAQGGGVDHGLAIADTMAVDYSIQADAAGVHLHLDTDFGQAFLNRNERALGGHLDSAVQTGGSSGVGRLLASLGNLQAGDETLYADIFHQLNPEAHVAPLQAQYAAARHFSGGLFGCDPEQGEACSWGEIEYFRADRSSTFEEFQVAREGTAFRGGYVHGANARWSLATSLGYDNYSSLTVDQTGARFTASGLQLGVGAYRDGVSGFDVSASLAGGWQTIESQRSQTVFTASLGEAEYETGFARAEIFAGQSVTAGPISIQPGVRLGVTALHAGGFDETGLAGLGARSVNDTQIYSDIAPEIAVDWTLHQNQAGSAVLSLTTAAVMQSEDRLVRPLWLTGANPASDPAMIGTTLDATTIRVDAGLDITRGDRLGIAVGYTGEFGEAVEQERAGVSVRLRF